MTPGDFALEAEVDFHAAVEHWLILAGVRSEWSRLRTWELASLSSLASQDSSHVGNAGAGVVSMRGALPSLATALFRRFIDCGCAVRCLLPLGGDRFLHLVALFGIRVLIAILGSLP